METLNIHAAKTHFSGLIERVENGETITIARAGKPVAKLVPLEPEAKVKTKRRVGFMAGEFTVPDDFNEMFTDEIEAMFNGDDRR